MADQAEAADRRRRLPRLRVRLRELYHGHSPGAVRFRLWVIAIDFLLIAFFIAAPFLRDYPVYLVVDYAVALVLATELGARSLADVSVKRFARRFSVWVDVFVLITLLFPHWLFNLAFRDITLPGTYGKLLTIVIMISGITLFVRFAQTLIRPYKVRFTCPQCGLMRHDPDAVHCKACGIILNIPNEE